MIKTKFITIPVALVILLALVLYRDSKGQILPYEGKGVVRWLWPVAVSPKETDETKLVAKELAKSLNVGNSGIALEASCNLFIEIDSWKPAPRIANFVIILQPGGGIIRATDTTELRAAIHALNEIKVQDGQFFDLPAPIVISDLPIESYTRKRK